MQTNPVHVESSAFSKAALRSLFFSERSLAPLTRLPQCVLCVCEWFSTLLVGDIKWMT